MTLKPAVKGCGEGVNWIINRFSEDPKKKEKKKKKKRKKREKLPTQLSNVANGKKAATPT